MYFKLVWWCVIDSCNRSLWSGEWIKKATETYISTQSIQAVYPSPVLNMWRDRSLSSVLTNRQSTAKLIWQNGEKALTKALVASKLYRSMFSESAWDYDWKVKIHDELQSIEAEFSRSTFFRRDENHDQQLLTCELSGQTCLKLAFTSRHHAPISAGSSLLPTSSNDLWLCGLRTRFSFVIFCL